MGANDADCPCSGDVVVRGSSKGTIMRPEGGSHIKVLWAMRDGKDVTETELVDGEKLTRMAAKKWRLSR